MGCCGPTDVCLFMLKVAYTLTIVCPFGWVFVHKVVGLIVTMCVRTMSTMSVWLKAEGNQFFIPGL